MKDYYIPDFVKINKEKPKEANKEAYQEELIIERKYIANLFDIPGFCIKNYKSKGPHFIQ